MKIIFAIPGPMFSKKFLHSWTLLLFHCIQKGYNIGLALGTSNNIYESRNFVFLQGGPVIDTGKPFGGMEYDYIFCLDSDQVFTTDQFDRIMAHDKDIVAGWYVLEANNYQDTCFGWYTENSYERSTVAKVKEHGTDLIDVDFVGLGFMRIKKGVIESLDFPWFQPLPVNRGMGFMMDDESFLWKVKEKGYKVWVDPSVRVGHEKMAVF